MNRTQTLHLLILVLVVGLSGGRTEADQFKADQYRVNARIVGQKYCRADADIFIVSLKVDIEIYNGSKRSVYLAPKMIPWIGKVAESLQKAESGQFLYEVTQSHYSAEVNPGEKGRIEPGKSVTLHSGYDLVARYNSSFSYPQSISAGNFALVLVLKPEMDFPDRTAKGETIKSLTTDPILFRVPDRPSFDGSFSEEKNRAWFSVFVPNPNRHAPSIHLVC